VFYLFIGIELFKAKKKPKKENQTKKKTTIMLHWIFFQGD